MAQNPTMPQGKDLTSLLATDHKYQKTYAADSSEHLAIVLLSAISSYLAGLDAAVRTIASHTDSTATPGAPVVVASNPVPPSPYAWLTPSPWQP